MREDEAGRRSCLVYYPGLADRKGPLWERFTLFANAHWILNDEKKEFFVFKETKGIITQYNLYLIKRYNLYCINFLGYRLMV